MVFEELFETLKKSLLYQSKKVMEGIKQNNNSMDMQDVMQEAAIGLYKIYMERNGKLDPEREKAYYNKSLDNYCKGIWKSNKSNIEFIDIDAGFHDNDNEL